LIDRWHSSILRSRICQGSSLWYYHYMVVAKVRERLAVSKQEAQKFDGENW